MSHLVVCGMNYHSAPISIRERFCIPPSCLVHALRSLKAVPSVVEAFVLSTCNRVEVYAVVSNLQAGLCEINSFFAGVRKVDDHTKLVPNFRLIGEDVALHLFRVAAGLDSIIIGEGQILSQIRKAYDAALMTESTGPILNYLLNSAINCGKRVRSETELGRRPVSVSSAAIELGEQELGTWRDKNILVVGAGRMAHLCVKQLANKPISGRFMVTNRTRYAQTDLFGRTADLPVRMPEWCDFDDRHKMAAASDLVFVATSAPEFVLTYDDLSRALAGSANKLCLIDISVPRNIDPRIQSLPGVKVYHADDLRNVVSNNLPDLEKAIEDADRIVFEKLDDFHSWQRSLFVVPTICDLHEKLEAIRREQTERTRRLISGVADDTTEQRIERLGRAMVAQIMHEPAARLKAAPSSDTAIRQTNSLRALFNL
jgi:glutamyl-tRNA reductase